MEHPISQASLERFAAGKASREENRAIVSHLLKGCAPCAAILRELECREPAAFEVDELEPAHR